MNFSKRIYSVVLAVIMVVWAFTAGVSATPREEAAEVVDNSSLIIWYTDDSLTDYLSAECVAFNEKYGIRVIPKLQVGDGYVENINTASVKDEGTPDLYIITNDSLEKVYLGGLAVDIGSDAEDVNGNVFPEPAIQAVTYDGKIVAYPLFFETSALLYNWTYLHDMAENQITAEESMEPDGSSAAGLDETEDEEDSVDEYEGLSHDEKVAKRIDDSIPQTFDELETFANSFDAPEQVETIFKWDVKDIFYNYFFVGNYMDVGGENGDDSSIINIYNMDVITALTVYQDLNQFFSFEYEDVTYDSVVQEFIEGKLIFTTATSDIIKKLEEAKQNGEFEYEYGVTSIPNLNDNLISKGMSVTSTVAVNGFSDKKDLANSFAKYLTVNRASDLYDMTGKLSACSTLTYENDAMSAYFESYSDSIPVPKMMATSNYWLLAEIAFSNIWSGKNVNGEIKNLSEQLKGQVAGVDISEDYLDIPSEDEQEIEYFDEDAEREAAQDDEEDSESFNE